MKKILVFMCCAAIVFACTKSKDSTVTLDCSVAKSYVTDVSPVIASTCATNSSCHGSGSTNGPGALTTYAQVFSARAAIRTSVMSGTMPRNGSLTAAQLNVIVCWIDSGALNN